MNRGIRDIGWVSLSLIARQGLGFLGTVVASRFLSTPQFAMYLVAVAAAVVFIPLADAGMWTLIARVAARSPHAPLFGITRYAGTKRFWYWLGIGLLVIPFTYLLAPGSGLLVILALTGAVGQANLDSMCGELMGHRGYATSASLRIASSVLGLVGLVLLLIIGKTAVTAMIVFSASRIIPPLIVAAIVRPPTVRNPALTWRVSIAFGLIGFLQVLYIRSDIIMLSFYGISSATVALYGVIYTVLIATQVIPSSLAAALYPRIASAGQSSWQRLFTLGIGVSFSLSVACCAFMLLSPGTLFGVFGHQYAVGVYHLKTLLLVILPISINQVATSGLQARDHEVSLLRLVVVILLINIGGNAALIPLMGASGAVIATMTAECVFAVGTMLMAGPEFWRHRELWPIAMVACSIGLSFFGAPSLVVSVTLFASLAALFASNSFGITETTSLVVSRLRLQRETTKESL